MSHQYNEKYHGKYIRNHADDLRQDRLAKHITSLNPLKGHVYTSVRVLFQPDFSLSSLPFDSFFALRRFLPTYDLHLKSIYVTI